MLLALRLAVYVFGGYLSMYCAKEIGGSGHYSLIGFGVGPIFGIVVLLWQSDSVRSLFQPQSWKFLILSTLTWAFVDWLFHVDDKYFYLAILSGSILLSGAHRWVFRSSWPRTCLAIGLSFAGFECVRLIPDASPPWIADIVNAASLWQGGYLLAMYGVKPRVNPR